jgi:phage-related minor tail protein
MQNKNEEILDTVKQFLQHLDNSTALDFVYDLIDDLKNVRDELEDIKKAIDRFVSKIEDNENIKDCLIIINGKEEFSMNDGKTN